MGRGPVVQARKNAVNSVKGKVFSLHAKLIAIAASKGGNPDDNPSLASAIATAKKQGVPNDNIERAIKKGTGEDNDGTQIHEILYEGYAPGGVAIMVEALTDNKNRTVGNIRNIFSKYGGNLGESGAVSWMFHKKGIIFIDPKVHDYDSVEVLVFETDAEDILLEEGYIKIICSVEYFHELEKLLGEKEVSIYESKVAYIPDTEIELSDFDKALKFTKMLEAFDSDEDVNTIDSNENISPELSKQVEEFIEKNTFHT